MQDYFYIFLMIIVSTVLVITCDNRFWRHVINLSLSIRIFTPGITTNEATLAKNKDDKAMLINYMQ